MLLGVLDGVAAGIEVDGHVAACRVQVVQAAVDHLAVGADGVQVILPYYFVPTVDGMLEHYKLLADELDIGMVIYNNPAFSGSWIKPAPVSYTHLDVYKRQDISRSKYSSPMASLAASQEVAAMSRNASYSSSLSS